MKVMDTPRTGRIGTRVAYMSPFGVCFRALIIPRNPRTPAQSRVRAVFGGSSQGWGRTLTELQRQRWVVAAQVAPSQPSLGQFSHLSGQQLFTKINSTLGCLGQPPVDEPPAPVVFTPNPVGDLTIVNDEEGGTRLLLSVGPATEDVMLFGQAPCNKGRMKHRRVCYLGLLGPATNGQCDITAAYTARFGQPAPGKKVFIVTCQTKNGWKAQDHVASAIVPPNPPSGVAAAARGTKAQPVTVAEKREAQSAAAEDNSPLPRTMYKGSTPDAPRMHKEAKPVHPVSIHGVPLVHSLRLALVKLAKLASAGIRLGRAFRVYPAPIGS